MTTEPTSPERPGIDPELREELALRHVREELVADLADGHSPDDVEQAVEQATRAYAEVPVRDFVPSLVERDARELLAESGQPASDSGQPASGGVDADDRDRSHRW